MRGLQPFIVICVELAVPLIRLAVYLAFLSLRLVGIFFRGIYRLFSPPKRTPVQAGQVQRLAVAQPAPPAPIGSAAGAQRASQKQPSPTQPAVPTLSYQPTDYSNKVTILCETISTHYGSLCAQALNSVSCPGEALAKRREQMASDFADQYLHLLSNRGEPIQTIDTPEFQQCLYQFAKDRRFGLDDTILRPSAAVTMTMAMNLHSQQRSMALNNTAPLSQAGDDASRAIL